MLKSISFKFVALLLSGGLLAACATIVDGGDTKPVSVNSVQQGQKFIVKNSEGKIVHQGVTPEIVNLPRSDGGYFDGAEYTISLVDGSSSATVESRTTGWYIAGNLLFGGLIGWLVVDPLTGAMYTLRPDKVSLQ